MNLYLRKVIHPQAHDNYRVVLKLDEGEFEIGSIGIMHAAGVQHLTTTPSWEHPGSESLTCARRIFDVAAACQNEASPLVRFQAATGKWGGQGAKPWV